SRSNRIIGSSLVEPHARALLSELRKLAARFGQLVAFPTSDLYLELLDEIYDEVAEFCFLPFNRASLSQSLDKSVQYAHCERLGVPCPRTRRLACDDDYRRLSELSFPLLLKPTKRDDATTSAFRSLLVDAPAELERHPYQLDAHMREGTGFVACELVPVTTRSSTPTRRIGHGMARFSTSGPERNSRSFRTGSECSPAPATMRHQKCSRSAGRS